MNKLWFENRKIIVLPIHIALFFLCIFKFIARLFFFLRKIIFHLSPGPLFVNGETRQHCQPDHNCFHYLFPPDWCLLSYSLLSMPFSWDWTLYLWVHFLNNFLKTWRSCFLLFVCLFSFKNVFLFPGKN